jgi:TP901 family phage tail tape measure protein
VADVNANIGVNIETSAALAQLQQLQREFSAFNASIVKSNTQALTKQRDIAIDLMRNVSATGKFSAEMRTISTSVESFTKSLEANKLTLGEYFKYGVASTKTFGKAFQAEFDTIDKVSRERVKDLQTRYVKLGRDASGAMKSIAIRPLILDMNDYTTKSMMAAQKQAMFNQILHQGSTQLLNFGKNTQWAGRQLMVGFTIPLSMLGSVAARTFMDMQKEVVNFTRVYGDMFTSNDQADKMVQQVQTLAQAYIKFGVAAKDTMALAAQAAQAGFQGADLMRQTEAASKLAVLGQIDQQQALQTTISLQNAFGLSSKDLADSINFLNAVENQTVTSIEDLTIAIPKAAPVIKQLGGDVKDLAFFLTAMKEGGVNASEGANAIKSGLASLINPTKKASDMLAGFGINITGIVENDKGNLRQTVVDFARALDTLDPLNRARAIEQLFGKFQFARMSTLFQNVIKDGSQASTVLGLAGRSATEMAILSEREMNKISDSVGTKFTASLEKLKTELMPLGKAFLEAATPVVQFVSKILDKFNGLSDGTKKIVAIIVAAVGAVGPVLLMTFGLFANGLANIMKLFSTVRGGFQKLTGQSQTLGMNTEYMTSEQIKNATVAASLEQVHSNLTQAYSGEASALRNLISSLRAATQAQRDFAMTNPRSMIPGYKPGQRYNSGTTRVPGSGNQDTVFSMLTPGEAVIPAGAAQHPDNKPIVAALVQGRKLRGYNEGTEEVTQPGKVASRTNVSKLPSGFIKVPSSILESRFKESDEYYLGNPIGSRTKFDEDYFKASPDEQAIMQKLKSSYLRNKDSVSEVMSNPGKVMYHPDGRIAVIGKDGKTWSLMSEETFAQHFGYITGSRKDPEGHISKVGFSTSRFMSRMPTKPPTGASAGVRKSVMESLPEEEKAKLQTERNWITDRFKKAGITDAKTIANYNKLDMSHLAHAGGGDQKWSEGQVVADTGLVNKYLQYRVQGGNPKLLQVLAEAESNPLLAKKLGLNAGKIASLKKSFAALKNIHPTTSEHYGMLREIAAFESAVGQNEPGKLSSLAQAGILGQIVDEYVGTFNKGAKAATVVDLAQIASKSAISRIRQGGNANDTSLALIDAQNEAILSRKGVQTAKAMGGVAALNRGMIPGRADGYDPTNPLQNRVVTYGTTGDITPEMRARRKMAEREAVLAKLEEKKAKALEEENKLALAQNKAMQEVNKETAPLKQRLSAYSGKVAIGAGAIAGVSIAASMAGGKLAEVAGQVMPLAFAVQGIATVLPLMANPWVAAVAAVAAIGFSIWKWNDSINQARKRGIELANSMFMTNNKLVELSKLTGTVSATELAQRTRSDSLIPNTTDATRKFGQNVVESDYGKSLMADMANAAKSGGKQMAVATLTNQMSNAIMQGILTTDQARGIVAALGDKLGSYEIPLQVSGNLTNLFGPNGENLLQSPLQIALQVQQQSFDNVQSGFENAIKNSVDVVNFVDVGKIVGGVGSAVIGGLIATAGLAAAPFSAGVSTGASVAGVGLAAAGAASAYQGATSMNQKQQQNNELAAAALQMGINQVAQNQGLVDSLNKQYDTQIKTLTAQKAATTDKARQAQLQDQINQKEAERKTAIDQITAKNKEQLDYLLKQANAMGSDVFKTAMEAQAQSLYKEGPMKVFSDKAISELSGMSDSKFKTTLEFQFASGNIDPVTILSLINMFKANPNIESKYNLLVTTAGSDADAALVLQLLSGSGIEQAQIPVYMDFINKDPKNFQSNMDALKVINGMKSKYGVTFDWKQKGAKEIAEVATAVTAIKDLPDPLTKKMVHEYAMNSKDPNQKALMEQVFANWDAIFGKSTTAKHSIILDFVAGQNANYMDQYIAAGGKKVSDFGKGRTAQAQFNAWKNSAAGQAEASAWYMKKYNPDTGTGGGGGGSTTTPTKPTASPLDTFIKQYQDLQNNTLKNLPTGWDASMKFLDSMYKKIGTKSVQSPFSGIEQDLRNLKGQFVGEDFISLITGMDPADFEKRKKNLFNFDAKGNITGLRQSAQEINSLIASINLGKFQSDNQKVLTQVQGEGNAFDILQKAGVGSAQALEMVKDQGLAAAIATGSIDPTKLKQMGDLLAKIKETSKGINLKEALSTLEGQTSLVDDGYAKAMERFSALEQAIDYKYADSIKKQTANIDAANKKIKGKNDLIGTANHDLDVMSEKETSINKAYDARLQALDEIKTINEQAMRQQQQQLTLAGALTSGDIAAAANAAQEMRAQNASDAQSRMTKALEDARTIAINSLVNAQGETRAQIEARIKNLKNDIYDIEQNELKPAQDALDTLNETIKSAKENLRVQGLSKDEWGNIKNASDLAKTAGDAYTTAMNNALTAIKAIYTNWTNLKDKTVYLNIVEQHVGSSTQGSPQVTADEKKVTVDPAKVAARDAAITAANKAIALANDHMATAQRLAFAVGQRVSDAMQKDAANELSAANAALAAAQAMPTFATGGIVPKYFGTGGFAIGTDTVPAMLTPGEFVVKKYAVENFGVDRLKSINSGTYSGESVYNYNLSVNVKSDANPDEIARAVMTQIKYIDSKKIRGVNN